MTATKSELIIRDLIGDDLYQEHVGSEKVANVVVNGAASSTTQKAVENAISDALKYRVKPYLSPTTTTGKKRRSMDDHGDSSGKPSAKVQRKSKSSETPQILTEIYERNAVVAKTEEKVSVDNCLPAADVDTTKREERGHSLAIRLQCNNCKKLLKNSRTLRKHMIGCKEERRVCKVCGKAYSKFDSLARHKLHHYNTTGLSTLKLKWNGESWKVDDERLFYRI